MAIATTCAGGAFNVLETRTELPLGSSSVPFRTRLPCVISRNDIPSCWNLIHPDRCRCLFLAWQPDANDYECCLWLRRRFQLSGSASSPTAALMPNRLTKQQGIPPNERGRLIALLRGNMSRGQPPRGH